MCGHAPLCTSFRNRLGIAARRVELLRRIRRDELLEAQPAPVRVGDAFAHRRAELQLRFELGAAASRAESRHDLGRAIGRIEQRASRGLEAADPAAGRIVGNRVRADREQRASGEHVRIGEEHRDVAVRVRPRQVAVFDFAAAEVERARRVERHCRAAQQRAAARSGGLPSRRRSRRRARASCSRAPRSWRRGCRASRSSRCARRASSC